MQKEIMVVNKQPIYLNEDKTIEFIAGMTIDADGSPRAYAPKNAGLSPLDYLANAGEPGNWYGIVTDKKGVPYIQGKDDPYPGYYISATAYQNKGFELNDPKRYLDSEKVVYIVVPRGLAKLYPTILGSKVEITNLKTGKSIAGIVGDIGPVKHLGEASILAAKELEINYNVKAGGTDERIVRYIIYPRQIS